MPQVQGTYRFVQAATAFVALLLCGLVYAWSLFVDPLEAEFGWTRAQTSLNFTISLITFSLGMLAAGWLDGRGLSKKVLFATAVLVAIGFVGCSFTRSLLSIYVCYGVLVGLSIGLVTDAVMAMALRWYPDKQGFASGAMLMGFGMGAMLLSPLVTMLLGAFSWRLTFLILGLVFGVAFLSIAVIMKEPPQQLAESLKKQAQEQNIISARDYTAGQMMRTPAFWKVIVWLILVSSGGLALISQAVPAAEDVLAKGGINAQTAVLMATAAMGSISLFNGLGRLLNGFLWDRFGHRVSVLWVSVGYILSMLLCAVATMLGSFPLVVVGFMLLGLMYGGNMSTMAAMCGSFFGAKYFSVNYAVATCQMIVASAVGPTLLATLQGASGNYLLPFEVFLGIAIVAFALSYTVNPPRA